MADPTRVALLRDSIRACSRCPLRTEATSPVPPRGSLSAELLVIGEAPGHTEDKEGRPFIGATGNLLEGCMREAGIDPDAVAYANAACCYPSKTKTPTRDHLATCRSNLDFTLSVWNPSIILTVGVTALSAFRPDLARQLQLVHGRPLMFTGQRKLGDGGDPIIATLWSTYHPASALPRRNPSYRETIVKDLENLVAHHKDNTLGWPEDCWRCDELAEEYDEWGVGTCKKHSMNQLALPLVESG